MSINEFAILADIGGSNIKKDLGAGDSVSGLNEMMIKMATAVGFVILAIAIVKMIIALADESAKSRSDAAIMFGVGIFFVAFSQVLNSLQINKIGEHTSINVVLKNVLDVLSKMLTYSGAALAVIGIFGLILAVANESAEQQTKATTLLMVSIGLISAKALTTAISDYVSSHDASSVSTKSVARIGVTFICTLATYGGGIVTAIAIFKFVMSIRTEDSRERDGAIRLFLVGIGLLSMSWITYNIFRL